MIRLSNIKTIAVDVDGTIAANNSVELFPQFVAWLTETAKQYPHLEWVFVSNQGGASWRHYCENYNVPYMPSDKWQQLPTPDSIYERLNNLREQVEAIVGKQVWIITTFAYRFKKPYSLPVEFSDNDLKWQEDIVRQRCEQYGDKNLYWPPLEPLVPTRHFSYDNLPKPSGAMIKKTALLTKATVGEILFIGDADGTPLDFYKNPRTEDMDEASAAGCQFSSPLSVWGSEEEAF